jgi:hypothetical protein
VTIQVKKLVEDSTKGSKRALLVLKIILEEEIAHGPSVFGKNLVNEISGQDGFTAARIRRHIEKTCALILFPRIPPHEQAVIGEPFACTRDSFSVSIFALNVNTGVLIEHLKKRVNFLVLIAYFS